MNKIKLSIFFAQNNLKQLNGLFSGLECYNTNRFVGVTNETEIEKFALLNQENGTFLAGLILLTDTFLNIHFPKRFRSKK